jgi:hypothetical protein
LFLISLDFRNTINKLDIYMKLTNLKKMSKKFVLESFQAYLDIELNLLNEANSDEEETTFTPTREFVIEFVKKLLEKQKELGNVFRPTFAKDKNSYESWLAKWKERNPGKDFPTDKPATDGAYAAPYLWEKLTEDQQNSVYDKLSSMMKDSGFKSDKEISNLIRTKSSVRTRPCITITPSSVKMVEKGGEIETKDIEIVGLSAEEENKLFKDNRWGSGEDSQGGKVNPDAFNDPNVLEDIKKTINEFIKEYASNDKLTLTSLEIQSSASRYRNTNENGGKAEKISWGELSYNRANTIIDLFREAATENNLSEEKRKIIQSKIIINSKGSNGDGTSGPNTPAPLKFGYYDEKGNFILDNGSYGKGKDEASNRKTIVIAELGNDGKPNGKYTTSEIDPLTNPNDYSQFKYVNFIIKAKSTKDAVEIEIIDPKIKTAVKYTPGVDFPKKSKTKKGWEFKIKIKGLRQKGGPGVGQSPFICNTF